MKCIIRIRAILLYWILSLHFEEAFNQGPISATDSELQLKPDKGRTRVRTVVAYTNTSYAGQQEPREVPRIETRKREQTDQLSTEQENDYDGMDLGDGDNEEQEPQLDFQSELSAPGSSSEHRRNLTKSEITAWVRESEQLFIDRSNESTSTSTSDGDTLEEFLQVLQWSAEGLCSLAKNESETNEITISGKTVTLHVEFITDKLQAELGARKLAHVNARPQAGTTIGFEVKLGESLSQYCSELDEGLAFMCSQLCIAILHYNHDLLSISIKAQAGGPSGSPSPAGKEDIWDSFLINADEIPLIIDPDNQPPAPIHKPLVFQITVPHLSRSHNVQCVRWNYSFWDSTSCLESQRISTTHVVECRCLQFGYLKLEYTSASGTNESRSTCPFLEFKVGNINQDDKRMNLTLIRIQLIRQLNLSQPWNIENLELVNVNISTYNWTKTSKIRFKLKHLTSGCGNCSEEWKTVVDALDHMLQNQSLNLVDAEGERLHIPGQTLRVVYSDEDQIAREMAQMNLVAAIILAILFGIAILFIGIVAIRKYRRDQRNSVRVLKIGNSFDKSLVPVSTILSAHSTHSIPNGSGRRLPKTNVRRMSFDYPDQNQNSFRNEHHENNGVSVIPVMNLHALPNSTLVLNTHIE